MQYILTEPGDIALAVKDKNISSKISNFSLSQNYPNPFNPSTKIKYSIPNIETSHSSIVQLKIYDILGREVATLVNETKQAGNYEVDFDADKFDLPSGIYFYQLSVGSFIQTKKMIFLKEFLNKDLF